MRGPDSAVKPREIIQTPRSKRQAATGGASARITDQAPPPRALPRTHASVGTGAPPAATRNPDFQHFFPPSNVILPQWSQHNGCFHTLRDKGRRLRHDTAPFQAEAGILESLKIRGKGKREQ